MKNVSLLNVVISELVEYANTDPVPDDVECVKTVVEYLQALNNFFELALLGNKVRIFHVEGCTLQRMEKEFNFFNHGVKMRYPKVKKFLQFFIDF